MVLTIGVYGFSEVEFFDRLIAAGIDLFCDIRARRGLRGPDYAFANSKRLQEKLRLLGIPYVHAKDLSPLPETRAVQQLADQCDGIGKRSRDSLGSAFIDSYRTTRLAGFDASGFFEEYIAPAARPVLFCVERSPQACHRVLLAEDISKQIGIPVEHLMP